MKNQNCKNQPALNLNLLNDLSNFGLDPKDWKITRKTKVLYRISHRSIENFQFAGYSRSAQKWQHLELASL